MPGLNLLGLWIYGLNIANANITQMVRCYQHILILICFMFWRIGGKFVQSNLYVCISSHPTAG